MSTSSKIKPGIYQHYKGPFYQVYEIAKHTETEEELVVYRYLYDDFGLTVRPLEMFVDELIFEGETVERFRFVKEANKASLGDLSE